MCRNENKDNIEYINVLENPSELYGYMKKYDFLDEDAPEEMPEDFDELSWFEGNPDIVKFDGQRGYFDFSPVASKREQICFVWFDCCGDEWDKIVNLLQKFWNDELEASKSQTWSGFDLLKDGVAYHGGCGSYSIYCGPSKPVFSIQIIHERYCSDITPMPAMVNYYSLDEAIDAARENLRNIESEELYEAYVFAGEKETATGDILGEIDAIYCISNLGRDETAKLRREYGYAIDKVDEYLIND